jgi:hypothetical protein
MLSTIFRGHITTILLLYGLLAIFLTFFNPYSLPAPFLFVPFVLFFGASFLTIYRFASFLSKKLRVNAKQSQISRVAILAAGLPTFLVLLQSVGQVTGYDVIISLVLFFAIDFYLSRSRLALFRAER